MKCFIPGLQGALLLLAALSADAQAQRGDAVLVDIAPCMELTPAAARHRCYDDLEAAARAVLEHRETDNAPVVQVPAREPAVPEPAPELPGTVDEFGQEPATDARVVANGDGERELQDRIASLNEREPGRWLITLESGQVWYQTNSSRIRLSKGMAVRIYPSPLGGSFRLAGIDGASTGFVQVTRVE